MSEHMRDPDRFSGIETDPQPKAKTPDMPIGLGMSLCMNTKAFNYFCSLDQSTRDRIIQHVLCSDTGEETKKKVKKTVKHLAEHDISFIG